MKPNGSGLPPIFYVQTTNALEQALKVLQREKLIAVDTESNSLYAYHTRVCLIQLSTRQRDYIIDPLQIEDMHLLGTIFANPQIEKVFHAAEYDVICLKREFHFEFANIFDTMHAAKLCGLTEVGLADVLRQYFEIQLDKSHQLDNWTLRPLAADSLRYAQMDTHFLPRLRDIFYDQLQREQRLPEALEIFNDVIHIEAKEREFDPHGYWKIGRPNELNRRQMAHLRELYVLREEIAQKEDKPPFKIFNNSTLVEIARLAPHNLYTLAEVQGVSEWQIRVYGDALLSAVERGRASRLPNVPPDDQPDPKIAERYMHLHTWRKERAAQRGIDSSLIIPKNTLWAIAEKMPLTPEALAQIQGMGAWRLQQYGKELLAVVAKLRK